MNCDQARTEIIAYLKNELSDEQKKRFEEHLARCPACRHEMEGARRLLTWTDAASEQAVVKKVEEILDNAIPASASDIHFDPQANGTLLVKYRIDGVLHEIERIPSVQRYGVVSRLKMMAEMNISEIGTPQDGRIPWKLGEREYDLRLNCTPYVLGESIVIRILDRGVSNLSLERLDLYDDQRQALERLLGIPCGILLVAGPAGSGRTTTCYSMLTHLNSPDRRTVTIENLVECIIPGINHAQAEPAKGFTYPVALRSFLKSDPDVIYISDIRDGESAALVSELAPTGHLCITSIYADTAIAAIFRMIDLGVEPFVVGNAVAGAMAQRLVRKPCPACAEEIDSNDPIIGFLGITEEELNSSKARRGKGCDACMHTGYKGRSALYEILEIDKDLREMIVRRSPEDVFEVARTKGFKTLVDDAKRRVLDGQTTPEEAYRLLNAYTHRVL